MIKNMLIKYNYEYLICISLRGNFDLDLKTQPIDGDVCPSVENINVDYSVVAAVRPDTEGHLPALTVRSETEPR